MPDSDTLNLYRSVQTCLPNFGRHMVVLVATFSTLPRMDLIFMYEIEKYKILKVAYTVDTA